MPLSVAERPVEVFGVMRRLFSLAITSHRDPEVAILINACFPPEPIAIELEAGNLEAYELLKEASDELIIWLFKEVNQELKITEEQFFFGCAAPAQLRPRKRVIGFVQGPGGIWIHSRRNGKFEADAPDVAHVVRDKGDIILTPVFKPTSPVGSQFFRTKTTVCF